MPLPADEHDGVRSAISTLSGTRHAGIDLRPPPARHLVRPLVHGQSHPPPQVSSEPARRHPSPRSPSGRSRRRARRARACSAARDPPSRLSAQSTSTVSAPIDVPSPSVESDDRRPATAPRRRGGRADVSICRACHRDQVVEKAQTLSMPSSSAAAEPVRRCRSFRPPLNPSDLAHNLLLGRPVSRSPTTPSSARTSSADDEISGGPAARIATARCSDKRRTSPASSVRRPAYLGETEIREGGCRRRRLADRRRVGPEPLTPSSRDHAVIRVRSRLDDSIARDPVQGSDATPHWRRTLMQNHSLIGAMRLINRVTVFLGPACSSSQAARWDSHAPADAATTLRRGCQIGAGGHPPRRRGRRGCAVGAAAVSSPTCRRGPSSGRPAAARQRPG